MSKEVDQKIRAVLKNLVVITSATTMIATTQAIAAEKLEKCYGIVKAGMNDCETSSTSCAGSAIKDNQSDAFVLVPQGLCNKIVGGKLKSSQKS